VLLAPVVAAAAAIEGPTWRLIRLNDKDQSALAASPQGVTVRFAAGRLEAFAGCNQLAGAYSIEGDRVSLGMMAGTMMACPEPAMAIENAFKAAFAGKLGYAVADDRLTLTSEAGATLVFQAEPPPRLEGVTWEVTGFNNGREAVVSPLLGTTLTLSFAEGTVAGNAGCNTYRAKYRQDGESIRIGPAAATRKMCSGEGVMAQEREFLAALESATTWAIIQRGLLDMHRADGARALTAKPRGKP
jgi:heat shock protein HslJ